MPPKKKTRRGVNSKGRTVTRNLAGMSREQRNQYSRVMKKPKEKR